MSFRNWHFQDWNQHFLVWDRNSSFSRVGFPSSLPGSHLGVEFPISLAPSPPIFFTLAWMLFARCKSDHIIFPHKPGDLCCPWIKSVFLFPGDFFAFHSSWGSNLMTSASSLMKVYISLVIAMLWSFFYMWAFEQLFLLFGGIALAYSVPYPIHWFRLYYTISRMPFLKRNETKISDMRKVNKEQCQELKRKRDRSRGNRNTSWTTRSI